MQPEEVRQAILALYRATDPRSMQAANAFLLDFEELPEAFFVSLALLEQGAAEPQKHVPEVLFVAANTLYSKIGRDWGQLVQQQQPNGSGSDAAAQLWSRLLACLRAYLAGSSSTAEHQQQHSQGARLVINRVGLALTAIALRDANPSAAVERLLGEAFALLGGDAAGVRAASLPAVAAGLGVIQSLPEEVERADMGRMKREALETALGAAAPQVLVVAEALLAAERPELSALGLRAVEGWVGLPLPRLPPSSSVDGEREMLSLVALAGRAPGLLERVTGVVGLAHPWAAQQGGNGASSSYADLLCAAARFLARLVSVPEVPSYPKPPTWAPSMLRILEALLAGLPSAVLADPPRFGEEAAHALASCFIEAAAEACEPLLAHSPAHGPPVAEAVLALTAHRSSTHHIATLALDFWAALAEVPLSQRVPALGAPLYARLTGVLGERLCYPAEFVSWEREAEEGEMEAEDFVVGYREGEKMRELVEQCAAVLKGGDFVMQLVRGGVAPLLVDNGGGGEWRKGEVALLMLQLARSVLAQVKQQGQQQTAWLLLQTMQGALASPSFQSLHPLLLRALLRFLAAYQPLLLPSFSSSSSSRRPKAASFASDNGVGLDEEAARGLHRLALRCVVLQGLASPGIEPPLGGQQQQQQQGQGQQQHQRQPGAAAVAFRAICVGALPSRLVAADQLECLPLALQALEVAASSHLPLPDRLVVAESAVRTLLAVPCPPANDAVTTLRPLLAGLTAPILSRLNAAVGEAEQQQQQQQRQQQQRGGGGGGGGGIPPRVLEAIAEGLQLIGQVVRFLDQAPVPTSVESPPTAAGGGGGAVVTVQRQEEEQGHLAFPLMAELWPLLERAAAVVSASEHRAVLGHLFAVQRHMVVGLTPLVTPRLPALLSTAARLYAASLHEGALETAGTAAEVIPPGDAERERAFASMLQAAAGPTFAHLCSTAGGGMGVGPHESPQLVRAFFEMLLRYLQFHPGVLYAASELPTALDLALACLAPHAATYEATRAALLFLRDLVKRARDAASVTASPVEQAALRSTLLPLLEARGPVLVRLSLCALAGGRTLSTLWANHLEFCFAFLQGWPVLAAAGARGGGNGNNNADAAVARLGEWVRAALADPGVLPPETFGPEERGMVVGLIGQLGVGPESSKPRLRLLLDDVRRVASGQCEAEALRSHLVS